LTACVTPDGRPAALCDSPGETTWNVGSAQLSVGDTTATAIAISREGLPLVAYRVATTDSIALIRCVNASCTGNPVELTLENIANDVGNELAMTIGRDGLPVISHFDDTEDALRVYHCGNSTCVPFFRRR
jgi:hypothetical protein